ncbi:MAG: nucleotidyltransferase domain-containing protein [Archaeoglobales archaeon]|nr:nucleotidyltransferase domain-containing protein [Archaeoglobales archaeon]
MIEYYRKLKENEKFFVKAFEIAESIKKKAEKLFGDCEVFIVGNFARGEHRLNSDLDLLIVSTKIPSKLNFEDYCKFVKTLTEDDRINIHLLNRKRFEEMKRFYEPMIRV